MSPADSASLTFRDVKAVTGVGEDGRRKGDRTEKRCPESIVG